MQDTLNDLSTDSIEKFEANYKKSDPQNLVYEIMTKLEQESTNPLKWAMKGDYLKSRDTFNKWKEILDSVLAEALFLEIYASALFPKVGQHGITKILEKTARYKEMLKEWEEDYLTKEYFWPEGIEQLMNEVHDKKSLSTKEAKVNKIWAGIESIMTNCKFYAVVVNSGHIYTLAELTRNTRAVISERNGFVIMIYHNSKKPRKQNEYVWLKEIVPVWNKRAKVLDAFNFNHWSMVRRYMEEDNIARLGHSVAAFIFAVAQSKEHIAVRYSKMDDGSLGPGHFTFDGYVVCDDAITKTTQPIFYLLGYRT
ncbi:hypothetical protein CRE_16493 [Caenorhabditis remanei]|uniref:Uncharacterized protein n=1 Tax=Caenorhabditis remanei TaxID=31234 RepID=E3NL92_CAERE|nr:hypothetical protein CRE_16493 [Caenorhabditis remanei]